MNSYEKNNNIHGFILSALKPAIKIRYDLLLVVSENHIVLDFFYKLMYGRYLILKPYSTTGDGSN